MKLNYKFSNLLGTVYRKGNVLFSPDGDTVISPVGNKITFNNLKEHLSETLAVECGYDIVTIALDAMGNGLLVFDEKGEAYYISLISQTIIHRHSFHRKVKACMFSPDSKFFLVCRDIDALLFRAPGLQTGQYNPFFLQRTYKLAHDTLRCTDWSHDSKLFVTGSDDSTVRVCSALFYEGFRTCHLSGHSAPVVACFFDEVSYDLISLDRQGNLICWQSCVRAETLKTPANFDEDELPDFLVSSKSVDGSENGDKPNKQEDDKKLVKDFNGFKKKTRFTFREAVSGSGVQLLTACYHKKTRILITGHSNGTFVIHEMPEFNLIHSLNVSDKGVSSLALNASGDWLAVASGSVGQLLVWEWQSETYVMKQQGHFHHMCCVAYSPDGQYLATGGRDSKVKIWTTSNGFCFVTFNEHTGNVTGVAWTQGGKAVISSSLDGTVRAFDLKRYRNFRTFVSPQPAQFSCVSVDSSGDLVCAGCQDIFDIFVWSLNTGRLLEVLAGHEAPVSALHFSPSNSTLTSSSWDKTLRIWDFVDGKQSREVVTHSSDLLCAQFSPDGKYVACCTLDCQILVYDVKDMQQAYCIECRLDVDVGRGALDEITQKKLQPSKPFDTICFSANSEYILAAGASRYVCMYHVKEQILVKKILITCNRSLDYVSDDLDRRKMTEFGNLALIDASDSEDEMKNSKIQLPGAKHSDLGLRSHHPEIRVFAVQFSPTGRAWAACSTEGLLIYSLDQSMLFDPYQLEINITPSRIRSSICNEEYAEALIMALKLNDQNLINECIEKTAVERIDFVCRDLPLVYVEKLLAFIGGTQLAKTTHVQFYLLWLQSLLTHHTQQLKLRSSHVTAVMTSLQQVITRRHQEIRRICDHNKYSLDYITNVRTRKLVKREGDRNSLKEARSTEESDEEMIMESQCDNDNDNETLTEHV